MIAAPPPAAPPTMTLEQALDEIAHLRCQLALGDETNRRLVNQINEAEATIEELRRAKSGRS